jgi:ABC-type dipeptide/oligopeptide/nickel transport system ATPase component
MESVDSMPWQSVSNVKLSGMFAKKKMRVAGDAGAGKVDLALSVMGGMFEIPKNVDDGKAIVTRFSQMKALPS